MADERTPEEQAYFDLLGKYKKEREETEEEEAKFQEDLQQALALSLSEDIIPLEKVKARSDKHSRQNRQFTTDRSPDVHTVLTHSSIMSSGKDNSDSHPSGRRRSVELAEEMRQQMLQMAEGMRGQLEDPNKRDGNRQSGRRRSVELAEEMQRQMIIDQQTGNGSQQFHASGRRRSIEIAKEMQRKLLEEQTASDDQRNHRSGRRRSVEMAEEMQRKMLEESQDGEVFDTSYQRRDVEMADSVRQQMLKRAASSGANLTEEEDVSREIQELIRRGLIPSESSRSKRHNRSENDSELFGDGNLLPTDRRVVGPRGSRARIPQHHRIDFQNPFEFGDDGFPVNWDKTRIPSFESEDLFNLVEIIPGEEEYETIARDFHIADLDVKKIERLQNLHLLDRYKDERSQMLRRRGRNFDVNARYLYHGSAANKLILCEEGLDARLGMSGCFGKGIYFSDNPKKCVQYVSSSDVPYILMCRVMLGDAKIYPHGQMDRDLKREPEKENPTGVNKYYDSVRGRPIDFNEFVIYENRRAMIEYIITFHRRGMPYDAASSGINQGGGAVAAYVTEEETIEDHMKRIQQVREEIRQTRAAERGEVYTGPTQAQKKKDREVWRRVLKVTCPPGTAGFSNVKGIYEYLDKEEKEDGSVTATPLQAASSTASDGNNNNNNNDEVTGHSTSSLLEEFEEEESVKLVMSHLVADFLAVTTTDNVQRAKMYLEKAEMNLDRAILLYYEEEAS